METFPEEINKLGRECEQYDRNTEASSKDIISNMDENSSQTKSQRSSNQFWEVHNKISTEIANYDLCLDAVKSGDQLNRMKFGNYQSNPNFQVSIEMMNKLELENAKLNEKLERLKLKEETSSFLNLSESQKLRHDIDRIEEINFRLRKVLAERIIKERELQEKIEQLQTDLEAGQSTDTKANKLIKSDVLKYYKIIEYFKENICSVVRHEEEERKQLEKKIDQLVASLSDVRKHEEELEEKLRKDDLTIRYLIQKIMKMKYDGENSTSNKCTDAFASNLKKIIDEHIDNLDEETLMPKKKNEKEVFDVSYATKSNCRSTKTPADELKDLDPRVKIKVGNTTLTYSHAKSQSDTVDISPLSINIIEDLDQIFLPAVLDSIKSITSNKSTQKNIEKISIIPQMKSLLIHCSSQSNSKLDTSDEEKNCSNDTANVNSSKISFNYCVDKSSSANTQKIEIAPKEQCQNCGTNFYQSLRSNNNKEFLSDTTLRKCYSEIECFDNSIRKVQQKAQSRNSAELLKPQSKRLSGIALHSNKSDHNIPNNIGGYKHELPFTDKLSDNSTRTPLKLINQNLVKSESISSAKQNNKEEQCDLIEGEIEATQIDFSEIKLDDLEKYLLKLGEQLKLVEIKLAEKELNFESQNQFLQTESLHQPGPSSETTQKNSIHNTQEFNEDQNVKPSKYSQEKLQDKLKTSTDLKKSATADSANGIFSSAENCLSRIKKCNESTQKLVVETSNEKCMNPKTCLKMSAVKKCICQDDEEVMTEINIYSSSTPAIMNVKFVDSQEVSMKVEKGVLDCSHSCDGFVASAHEKRAIVDHNEKIGTENEPPLGCKNNFLQNQTHENIEKYISHLGRRCGYLETHLKEQQVQYELLCNSLKIDHNKSEVSVKSTISRSSTTLQTQKYLRPVISDRQLKQKVDVDQMKRKSSESFKQPKKKDQSQESVTPHDHQKCESLEKYISRLNLYMQDIETCLKQQKKLQVNFLDTIQNSGLIKPELGNFDSVKVMLTPSSTLKETRSSFIESISHPPSEDEYFMIKACSSKELLIDKKLTISDISNSINENGHPYKLFKPEASFKDVKNRIGINSNGSKFQIIEAQCGNLEKHLKIIEANLKYQDAIYHFLKSSTKKNKTETDVANETVDPQDSSLKLNNSKLLDLKSKRKRKTFKTKEKNPDCNTEPNLEANSSNNKHNTENIEKRSDEQVIGQESSNVIKPNINDNKLFVGKSKNMTYKINFTQSSLKNLPEHKSPSCTNEPATKDRSIIGNKKSFDIANPLTSSNSSPDIFFNEDKSYGKTPKEVIQKMIERIERNTILLEKRMNSLNTSSEDKEEIHRSLKKLLKDKQLVSRCIKENMAHSSENQN